MEVGSFMKAKRFAHRGDEVKVRRAETLVLVSALA
jgi:hypothetical protein